MHIGRGVSMCAAAVFPCVCVFGFGHVSMSLHVFGSAGEHLCT